MKNLRFLIAGDFASPIHEPAICDALEKHGVEVYKFQYKDYFRGNNQITMKFNNFQKKFSWGPSVWKLNMDLRRLVESEDFDCVFFYRPTFIKSNTLAACAQKSIVYFYNNDDPFSPRYTKGFWKDYFVGLPYCTHIFFYRDKNRQDYLNAGYNNCSLLRSYYINSLNYPMEIAKKYDVVFVGHYENDKRDEWLKYLIDRGAALKIFGPEWHRSRWAHYLAEKNGGPIAPLGKEYNKVINEAKIALVFLSTLNSDTYTRRCFEIPAAGTFMLCRYSDDMAKMFEPGKDADYFGSKEELFEKIQYYLSNEALRERVAQNGRLRVVSDNHEVTKRVEIILKQFNKDNRNQHPVERKG